MANHFYDHEIIIPFALIYLLSFPSYAGGDAELPGAGMVLETYCVYMHLFEGLAHTLASPGIRWLPWLLGCGGLIGDKRPWRWPFSGGG